MARVVSTSLLSICLAGTIFIVTLKTLCGALHEEGLFVSADQIIEPEKVNTPLDEEWEEQSKENLERWIAWYEWQINQPRGNEAIPSGIPATEENCEREADRNYEEHMKHPIPWPTI